MGIKCMNRYLMQNCKKGSIEKKLFHLYLNKPLYIL